MQEKSYKNSYLFRNKIHNLIPGGAHTYSKGDDQFPALSPAAIAFGKGAYIWDVDGNKFLDCAMGLASVSIGHAYESIVDKVYEEMKKGVNFQRPSYLEAEMAEKFLSLVTNHDMIKFAKNGSTVTTAAVKLARAYTKRDLVAFPHDHPFYSYDDWFIGKTSCDLGVPESIKALSVTFKSCDLISLENLFKQYPEKIACVISEPEKNTCSECKCKYGPGEFLEKAIALSHKYGALFILDEMQSGFRSDFPGSMTKYGIKPDLATWGKGIANGFSFSALTGIKDVMNLGAINQVGREKFFLISTTHGAETHSMRACLETIKIFQENDVIAHNHGIGKMIIEKCAKIINNLSLEKYVKVIPCNWMPGFQFLNKEGEVSQGLRTLIMQEMLKRNILFQGAFVPCYSHTKEDVSLFANALEDSLKIYSEALDSGYDKYLIGNPVKPVFRKII
jgi:glutamate-1-semialdehyde 2,1-aminomutase